MSDIRVCTNDDEPMVFTFEFPGAEYVCQVCGGLEGIFGKSRPTTVQLALRLDELTEQSRRERAERRGETYVPEPKAGDPDVELPVCKGCGATPEAGLAIVDGKPRAWFSRAIDGVTEYACKRTCIPASEPALPW